MDRVPCKSAYRVCLASSVIGECYDRSIVNLRLTDALSMHAWQLYYVKLWLMIKSSTIYGSKNDGFC